jgi:KDO2-lipid IV(A) lauroyltransferase
MLAAGSLAGRLGGRLVGRKRRQIVDNLDRAGVANPRRSAKLACRHLGRTLAELTWILSQSNERLAAVCTVEGLDTLREKLGAGRGVLLASGHLGNWEIGCHAIARSVPPVAVVARPLRSPWLERRTIAFRERGGVRTFVLGRPGASLGAYRWLSRGGILGCLIDRPRDSRRVRVPFLSRHAHVSLGPAELACRVGSPVVLATGHRGPDGRTRVHCSSVTDDPGKDPEALAVEIGRQFEATVRANPEQWLWIYRRSSAWREDA